MKSQIRINERNHVAMTFAEYILREKKKKLITEGKHWPEDYVKTARNMVKQS